MDRFQLFYSSLHLTQIRTHLRNFLGTDFTPYPFFFFFKQKHEETLYHPYIPRMLGKQQS